MGDKLSKRTDGGLVQQRSNARRETGAHEQPGLERHRLPGAIRVGDYHEYSYAGRRRGESPSTDGDNLWLSSDEWLVYDVDVAEPGPYELTLQVAAADGFGGGDIGIVVDDKLQHRVKLDATGGWFSWDEVTTQVELPRGFHTVRLVVIDGGWKLRGLRFR